MSGNWFHWWRGAPGQSINSPVQPATLQLQVYEPDDAPRMEKFEHNRKGKLYCGCSMFVNNTVHAKGRRIIMRQKRDRHLSCGHVRRGQIHFCRHARRGKDGRKVKCDSLYTTTEIADSGLCGADECYLRWLVRKDWTCCDCGESDNRLSACQSS
jgi:hypothetical protein